MIDKTKIGNKTISSFLTCQRNRSKAYLIKLRGHVGVTQSGSEARRNDFSKTLRKKVLKIYCKLTKSEFLNDDPKIKIDYLSGPFSRSASVDFGIKSANDGPLLVTDVDMVFNQGWFQSRWFELVSDWVSIQISNSYWLREIFININLKFFEDFLLRCSNIPNKGKTIYFPIVFRQGFLDGRSLFAISKRVKIPWTV